MAVAAQPAILLTLASVAVLLALAYGLGRAGHYMVAAMTAVCTLAAVPFINIILVGDYSQYRLLAALMWLSTTILLGSLLFSMRGMLALASANILGMLLLPLFISQVDFLDLLSPVSFVAVISAIALSINQHRNLIERDRLAELSAANRELETPRASLEQRVQERTTELARANKALQLEIAERERAEQALAGERNLLRTLIDNLPDYVFVKDVEGRYVVSNVAHQKFLGVKTLEQVVGKTVYDLFPEPMAASYVATDQEILHSGKPSLDSEELSIDQSTGSKVWNLTTKVPLRDGDGKVIGLVGISRDITARRRAEEELRRHNAELATLNQVGQALSRLAQPDEILGLIYTMIGQVLDNRNLYIALYDPTQQRISFPIYTMDGQRHASVPSRPFSNGLTEYIIRTKTALLIPRNMAAIFQERGIESRGRMACCYLGVPMQIGERVIGVIAVQDYEHEGTYDAAHGELLATFASQAAIALENARLYAALQQELAERRRAEEAEREQRVLAEALCDTAAALSGTLSFDEVLDRILANMGKVVPHDTATIMLVESDAARVVRARGFVERGLGDFIARLRLPLADTPDLREIMKTRQSFVIPDTRTYPGWIEMPEIDWIRSSVKAPIRIKDQVIGILTLDSTQPDFFTMAHAEHLQVFADQAALALENARLLEEMRQHARELQRLEELGRQLNATLDFDAVVQSVADAARELVGATEARVFARRSDDAPLRRSVSALRPERSEPVRPAVPRAGGTTETILRTGKLLIIPDLESNQNISSKARARGVRRTIGIPIQIGNRTIGVLFADSDKPHAFDEHTQELLSFLAAQAATAIQNARLYAEARENEVRYRRQAARLQIAAEIGRAATSTLDLDALLCASVELLKERLGWYHVAVYTIEPGSDVVALREATDEAGRILKARHLQFTIGSKSLIGAATATRQPQIAQDVTLDSNYLYQPLLPETRAEAVIPLLIGETVGGALDVESAEPNSFAPDDLSTLTVIADQIAVAIQNARLHAAVKERARELEHAYRTLQENQEQLLIAEKMASLGRLTAGIAHEMNTPLAAARAALAELGNLVKEYQDSVGDPEVTPDDQREIAQEMQQSIRLANSATERVASFVRGIKGQTRDLTPQERHRFDAVPVIRETLLLLSYELRKQGCKAVFEPAAERVELYGSPGRLAQIVTNLVANSIDAYRAQGGGLITLRLTSTDDGIALQVSDLGSGIPPEIVSKIFDPMFTTKPFGQGTGMGLTIVHDIVTSEFGGTISVSSQSSQGTTFTLRFPRPA